MRTKKTSRKTDEEVEALKRQMAFSLLALKLPAVDRDKCFAFAYWAEGLPVSVDFQIDGAEAKLTLTVAAQ